MTGPAYYDGANGLQPFDIIDEFSLDFYEGNIVKYIVRWRKKDGISDLRKARTYIDELIKRAETAVTTIEPTEQETPTPPFRPALVIRPDTPTDVAPSPTRQTPPAQHH